MKSSEENFYGRTCCSDGGKITAGWIEFRLKLPAISPWLPIANKQLDVLGKVISRGRPLARLVHESEHAE